MIEVSERSASTLGRIAQTLAEGEGLSAHARAAQMRIK
jgi:histidinol dehydrogenase